jgi:AcrR family transcriptional regulator
MNRPPSPKRTKATAKGARVSRRRPRQQRAQQTVDAVLDSVARLLKRGGVAAVTTNRIAEVAGVSIGSVYQYFPNKQAIFTALLDRHHEAMVRLVEAAMVDGVDRVDRADAPFDDRIRGLVEAMVAAHATDPDLHQLLFTQVPQRPDVDREIKTRVRAAFRLAIESRAKGPDSPRDLERMLFVLTHMVEALTHAAVLHRPSRMSLAAASDEAVRAVLAYLNAERDLS